jgi:hypothetical protein
LQGKYLTAIMSDTNIPTSQGPVNASDETLEAMMTVIRGDPTQLFTDHIRYTPLRSVEGLLAATKPLSTSQIRPGMKS